MNVKLGLKIFSAAACVAVWGCMAVNDDAGAEARASRANTLKFVDATSTSLAKAAGVSVQGEGMGQVDIAAAMRSAGICEKFITLVEDMSSCGQETDCEEGLPQSLLDFISCFGVEIDGEGSIEDIDSISAKLQNFQEFESCVCGGSGSLFGSYDHLKWQTFSASASVAAGAAFSASQSSVTADGGFDASSSSTTGGEGFSGSSSHITSEVFSGN